jgi:hypothetical protein
MMAEFYKGNIPIIDVDFPDDAMTDMLHPKGASYGLVERDYDEFPESMFAPPSEMALIPESEWDARFDEQERLQSSLEHIYLSGPNGTPAFVNLDQGQEGYCWIYSVGHSVMMDRLRRNIPLVRLNPHSIGAIIKKGRNEGGWCGEGGQFVSDIGMAPEGNGPLQWPKWSRDIRKFDTPAMRQEMAKYRIDEQWVDLTRRVWDRNLTMGQVATSGFLNIPGPGDYNWWSHSVLRVRWVRIERGSWGQLILNSWLNWGRHGLGVLRGNKAICNGALAIRSTTT